MNYKAIEHEILAEGWYYFKRSSSDCPGMDHKRETSYARDGILQPPCDSCFKALLFWDKYYSSQTVTKFGKLIKSFGSDIPNGKFNHSVVVFYFRDQPNMLAFLKRLEPALKEYGVMGFTQWRKACREYQDMRPELWKNAKELR